VARGVPAAGGRGLLLLALGMLAAAALHRRRS
jgi:MYXO-CTERM domain-containing protein